MPGPDNTTDEKGFILDPRTLTIVAVVAVVSIVVGAVATYLAMR